jgi:hypothetical protein
VLNYGTFCCSYFVSILMKFGITRSATSLFVFFLITFILWMESAACLMMSFCPPWKVRNFLPQILQRTRKSSPTTRSLKWYFCCQNFFYATTKVGLKFLTLLAISFGILPGNANPTKAKINTIVIFNPSQQARALYATTITNTLKLNWLIFNNRLCCSLCQSGKH